MTTSPISPEAQRQQEEEALRRLREQLSEGSLPRNPFVRLPTEDELVLGRPPDAQWDRADGAQRILPNLYPGLNEPRSASDTFLLIDSPEREFAATGTMIYVICVDADAFASIDDVIAWFTRNEPVIAENTTMLPQYWVVGTHEPSPEEFFKLSDVGATFDLCESRVSREWLRARMPRPSVPPAVEKTHGLRIAPPPPEDPPHLNSWERDQQRITEAHIRGLMAKHDSSHVTKGE